MEGMACIFTGKKYFLKKMSCGTKKSWQASGIKCWKAGDLYITATVLIWRRFSLNTRHRGAWRLACRIENLLQGLKKSPGIRPGLFLRKKLSLHRPGVRIIVALGHFCPIDDVEKRGNIIGAAVLVVQVVGVLPHVKAEDGGTFFIGHVHEGVVLVGRGGDEQLVVAVCAEPGPTGAETGGGSGRKFLFEVFKRPEVTVNRFGDVHLGGRLAAAIGRHDLPKEGMVVIAAAIVAHGHAVLGDVGEDVLDLHPFKGGAGDGVVEVGGVPGVVLAVVDFHRAGVNVRFERIEGIGECWKLKSHSCFDDFG